MERGHTKRRWLEGHEPRHFDALVIDDEERNSLGTDSASLER